VVFLSTYEFVLRTPASVYWSIKEERAFKTYFFQKAYLGDFNQEKDEEFISYLKGSKNGNNITEYTKNIEKIQKDLEQSAGKIAGFFSEKHVNEMSLSGQIGINSKIGDFIFEVRPFL
jgi:hypothetical protein